MPSDDRIALAVCRDPRLVGSAEWADVLHKARVCLSSIIVAGTPTREVADDDTLLLTSGTFTDHISRDGSQVMALVPSAVAPLRARGSGAPAPRQFEGFTEDELLAAMARVAPPFGYVARDARGRSVLAGTDCLGLQHVYVTTSRGLALVSTSSTVLARLTQARLDEQSCSTYSLIGNFLSDRTVFEGVRKLRPGEAVVLRTGAVQSAATAGLVPVTVRGDGWFRSQDEAVDVGREVLQSVVSEMVAVEPAGMLELSGGLDSRVVLGLIRHGGHGTLSTFTIGSSTDADVMLARRIASENGLNGHFVSVSLLDGLAPRAVRDRVQRAAQQRDFSADPVSGALYDALEDEVPATAQISAIGGELARGNYYTGQRSRQKYDRDLVYRIIRWRLVSNWAASEALFDPEFRREAEAALRDDAWSYVDGLGVPWPIPTDELYLFARLVPWGGAVYSRRGADRRIVAPLYHPRFVEWASRIPVRLKRNSRTFAALLHAVAPDLAQLPLDTGVTPFELMDRSPRSGATRLAANVRRATRKVRRQLERRGKTPVGTERLANSLLRSWNDEPPQELASVDWLDQQALEQCFCGQLPLNTSSVAFLANVAGALEQINARG